MKVSIDSILKNISEIATKKAALEEQLQTVNTAAKVARETAERAAVGGDVDAYMAAKADAERHEAAAHVLGVQIAHLGKGYSADEVKAAWGDYAGKFNKELDSKMKDYLTARRKLWECYRDMLTFQNEALKKRKVCSELMGFPEGGTEVLRDLPMHSVPYDTKYDHTYRNRSQVDCPESIFFLSCGEATEADHALMNNVLRMGIALD